MAGLAHRGGRRGPGEGGRAAPEGPRWVTLSNRRRVLIDEDGRILRGLPGMFEHVHVRDLSALAKGVREAEREGAACETGQRRRRPRTFRTVEDGVRALLAANPDLVAFLEFECSRPCDEFRSWVRRGRRGPKPLPTYGDGRFDALEVPLDLDGKRAISSWLEAVYVIVPPSRRWADFPQRLQYLADATGLTLQLPEPAEQLHLDDLDVEQCKTAADERVEALITLAREARLPGAEVDDEAPF